MTAKSLITSLVLAAALMTTPAHAADADIPTCKDFRARLAAAQRVLEVDVPTIETFRAIKKPFSDKGGDWDLKIGDWPDTSTLHCTGDDSKVGQLGILLPFFGRPSTREQLELVRNLAAVAIYAYTGGTDPEEIMAQAENVLRSLPREVRLTPEATVRIGPTGVIVLNAGPVFCGEPSPLCK